MQQQGPATCRGLRGKVTVEASYDDGATWTPVPATVRGTHGRAVLTHPAATNGTGWVSLRASGTDQAGDTFSRTVIRAHQLA